MLKRCAAGLLSATLALSAGSQVVCSLGPNPSSYKADSDERPTPDALQLVSRLNAAAKTICKSSCPGVAVFRNASAPNSVLLAEGDHAKLVYAPRFLAEVEAAAGDTGVMAIIAHQMGHALDDAMGAQWIRTTWSAELRADSWAGCTLARMNLSSAETQAAAGALRQFGPAAAGNWAARLPAIRAGYAACGGDAAKFDVRK